MDVVRGAVGLDVVAQVVEAAPNPATLIPRREVKRFSPRALAKRHGGGNISPDRDRPMQLIDRQGALQLVCKARLLAESAFGQRTHDRGTDRLLRRKQDQFQEL